MYIDEHLQKWDELHHSSQSRLKYPNENVVRFVKSQFPQKENNHILDLGCGAGRHIVFLAQEGYKATGIDFSKSGLDLAQEILHKCSLEANLIQGSILKLPFADNVFDGMICYGVLYYFESEDLEQAVQEMFRTLKKGGKAFIVVRSCRDKRYGKGEQIDKHVFKMDTNFSNELGMIIQFFDQKHLKNIFGKFSEVNVGLVEESLDSLDQFNSDYLVTVTK